MEQLKVRVGTLDDLDPMMELAMAATDENAFVKPDPAKLLASIYPALARNHGIVGIIGEPKQRIEGAVVLNIGEIWYSTCEVLEEKAIYVHPEFRAAKGGRAARLVEFSKQVSEEIGIPLAIGVLSTTRTAAKIRLYERMLGQPAGVYFLYGATTGLKKEKEAG